MNTTLETKQVLVLEEVLQRIAGDLSMIADRNMKVGDVDCERMDHRPAGEKQVHISFRMGFQAKGQWFAGCVLIPFVDAVALAGCLLMLPEATLVAQRKVVELDPPSKDAMLEVGNFISGATDAALRSLELEGLKVVFDGCQGVRANVRPALIYEEGEPLWVARSEVTVEGFDTQSYIVMLPEAALTA